MSQGSTREQRVAVMVDCDNTTPDILEYALQMAAQFGRVQFPAFCGPDVSDYVADFAVAELMRATSAELR